MVAHCSEVRDISEYIPLAQRVARSFVNRRSIPVAVDDVMAYAFVGLRTALEQYDPERCDAVEPFVIMKVERAITDGLRAEDPVPRSIRDRLKRLSEAEEQVTAGGHTPTEQRVAERLGEDRATVGWLGTLRARSAEPVGMEGLDVTCDDPNDVTQSTIAERLGRALDELPEREALVMRLYYSGGMTLEGVGRVVGLTPSGVARIQQKALQLVLDRVLLRVHAVS